MSKPAVIQSWEGVVTGVGDGEFHADLTDSTPGSDRRGAEDVATVPLDSVPEEDRQHVVVGRWFVWEIRDDETSTFRFIPNRAWTQEEIDRAEHRASQWFFALSESTSSLPPTSWD
ncbi:hypothetical protein [Alienimonas sp. DA493]|uniref:hypothetical protein n=1 Tax=Alienimonas sp. DA493 TaxID=3373605 RepID=UPI003754E118